MSKRNRSLTTLRIVVSLSLGVVMSACDADPEVPWSEANASVEAEQAQETPFGVERDEEADGAPSVKTIERELAAALQPSASGSAVAAITQQIVPNSQNDPAFIELVTVTSTPHRLIASAQDLTLPSGLGVLWFAENVGARKCNPGSSCKQRWNLYLDISEVCELDGSYNVDFSVGCAPGSDCSQMDPDFTEYSVPFILNSENFCSEWGVEICLDYDVELADLAFCTEECPCSVGQGDCDSDSECAPGLECVHNVGALYGLYPSWDLCLPSS